MSSEDMRVELESFVNRGLQEGWHGWPRKNTGRGDEAPGERPAGGLDRFTRRIRESFGLRSDAFSTRQCLFN